MKKLLRVIIILAGLALAAFIALFIAYLAQKKPTYYTSYENAKQYSVGSFTIDAGSVDAVDIDWVSGTLRFCRASGTVLSVAEPEEGLSEKQRVRWWLDGRTLRIRYWASNYGTDAEPDKALTLDIPDGIALTVFVKRGTIRLDNHDLLALDARVSAGDIEAGDLTVEQACALNCGGGGITIGSVTTQSATIDDLLGETRIGSVTLQGSLRMKSSRAALYLGSVTADSVTIEKFQGIQLGLGPCGSVDIRTNSGDIALTVASGVGATVDYKTWDGKLNGKPIGDSAQLVVGDGACKVKIEADSGDLTVDY